MEYVRNAKPKKVELDSEKTEKTIYRQSPVTVKTCGDIVEAIYMSCRNTACCIRKISKEQYIDLRTGEVKDYKHIVSRKDDLNSVRCSLRRIREIINTNVRYRAKIRWITLTYAENMTDTDRLYKDFEKFMKRFRYEYGDCEYITAAEPQGRGAWHFHILVIFPNVAPYIQNDKLRALWGQGFVKVKSVKENVTNVGAYLTAYLGDMEVTAENCAELFKKTGQGEKFQIKEVKEGKKTKKYIKGGRLHLYPSQFHMYRASKGLDKPTSEVMTEDELQSLMSEKLVTYKKAVKLVFWSLIDNTSGTEQQNGLTLYYRYWDKSRENALEMTDRRQALYDAVFDGVGDSKCNYAQNTSLGNRTL